MLMKSVDIKQILEKDTERTGEFFFKSSCDQNCLFFLNYFN